MKTVAGALLLILLAGPAFAQDSMGINLWNDKQQTPEQKERNKAIDSEYKSTINGLPERQSGNKDPWGTVRSSNTPQNSKSSKVKAGSR